MAHDSSRYLRFARALAFLSGIAPVGAGCALQHGVSDDLGGAIDAPLADAGSGPTDGGSDSAVTVADAGGDTPGTGGCSDCRCVFGGDDPDSCDARGLSWCCVAVGPLSPPELPA